MKGVVRRRAAEDAADGGGATARVSRKIAAAAMGRKFRARRKTILGVLCVRTPAQRLHFHL